MREFRVVLIEEDDDSWSVSITNIDQEFEDGGFISPEDAVGAAANSGIFDKEE